MAKKNNQFRDRDFQELAAAVNSAIIKNDGLIGDQKEQVELVMELEEKFKYHISKYQQTVEIYRKFIKRYNNDDEEESATEPTENRLSAQPYFREKTENFKKISTRNPWIR